MNILLIEEEIELSKTVCEFLNNEDFACQAVHNYVDAQRKLSKNDYSCVILDLNLPDGGGEKLFNELMLEKKPHGILILSGSSSINDKVNSLRAGADDYLTKPFYLPELAARVSAIIRRKSFEGSNVLALARLELDINLKKAVVNGKQIVLTKKEYSLLVYFLINKAKVVSKDAIAVHLWGDETNAADNYDIIYTHIKNLKKKLSQAESGLTVQPVYGLGYKIIVL